MAENSRVGCIGRLGEGEMGEMRAVLKEMGVADCSRRALTEGTA